MIYQPLRLFKSSYFASYRYTDKYPEHKHPSIELFYCAKGSYNIIINRKPYFMNEGDIAVISPLLPHELPDTNSQFDSLCIVIDAGSVMLDNYYSLMATKTFPNPIFKLKCDEHIKLYELMEETGYYILNPTQTSPLHIKSNIYKIFAYIFENFIGEDAFLTKEALSVANIEKALEYIYSNYEKKITIEDVATMCGYSKTNFCRIFKNITNETFHNVLNNHRIKISCTLLKESDSSIEDIALQVGFNESKSFCRVFKSVIGVSPGTYRKKAD